jgi:molybdopterin-guanine dinucleotide biosynthesis protein A
MHSYPQHDITGVVLAGGAGRRMGGVDKGLTTIAGAPMAAHVITALRQQCANVLVNANRNEAEYAQLGCPVFADQSRPTEDPGTGNTVESTSPQFDGPLAGIAAALDRATTTWVLVAPCDSPLVAPSLGSRLWTSMITANRSDTLADVHGGADGSSKSEARNENWEIAVAHDGERLHPVFALLRSDLAASAHAFLARGERKIDRWYAEHATIKVQLPDLAESFVNVNRVADKDALEARLCANPIS